MDKQDALRKYYDGIDKHGLTSVWQACCSSIISDRRPDVAWPGDGAAATLDCSFADEWPCDDLPDLYEAGLAHEDKARKRSLGQYYTPADTARFMASKLIDAMSEGKTLVEPCVGCGNLLIEMLRLLPDPWGVATSRMIVFDLDETAMLIAMTRIIVEFAPRGAAVSPSDFDMRGGDFLLSGFDATDGHVVISNPPYGRADDPAYRNHCTYRAKDLYPMFLEHLMGACRAAIIVPQGFLGSPKFSSLRSVMSEKAGGAIFAYDNMPTSMFNKRKHGVFNTNASNSVRAAIVVSEAGRAGQGWSVSPMIRWVADERAMLFDASDRLVTGAYVSDGGEAWPKVPAALVPLYGELRDLPRLRGLCDAKGHLELYIPSTPRYFVTAAAMPLDRTAFHTLRFSDERSRNLAYLVLNSSLSYCWWRWHDGGITISRSTLMDVPVPVAPSDELDALAEGLIAGERGRVVVKMNAGRANQNLKLGSGEFDVTTRAVLPGRSEAEYEALAKSHSNNLAEALRAWERRGE